MDPVSRVERDPRSGAQLQSDEPGTGGQWDDSAGQGQGQWKDDVDQRKRSDVRDRGGAGQFSSPDRFTSDDTSGSGDFRAAQVESDDDPAVFGGHGAKPSVADRAKGTAEKMAGKVARDPGMQARGEERKEGLY